MVMDRFKLVFILLLLFSTIFVILTTSYYREKTDGMRYQIAGKKSKLPQKPVHQHGVCNLHLWPDKLNQSKVTAVAWNQGANISRPDFVSSIEGGGLKTLSLRTLSPMSNEPEKNLSLSKTSNLSSDKVFFAKYLTVSDIWLKEKAIENVASTFEANRSFLDSGPGNSIYGKAVHGRGYTVVYNRVPKCGGRTFVNVANILAKRKRHGPGIPKEVITPKRKLKIQAELRINKDMKPKYSEIFRERLNKVKVGSFLHGHVYYVDFSEDEMLRPDRRPLYFNLIRDPINRLVSQYYFVRNGDVQFTNLKQNKLKNRGLTNETINECVLRSRPECVGTSAQGIITTFFCGYDPECEEPSEGALQRAKHNLERYVVVGVAEQYEDFLKVLEHLLPGYFKGIFDMYKKYTKNGEKEKFRTKMKIAPTDGVKDKLRTIMEVDYKFYNYTREKFNRLKRSLGIT